MVAFTVWFLDAHAYKINIQRISIDKSIRLKANCISSFLHHCLACHQLIYMWYFVHMLTSKVLLQSQCVIGKTKNEKRKRNTFPFLFSACLFLSFSYSIRWHFFFIHLTFCLHFFFTSFYVFLRFFLFFVVLHLVESLVLYSMWQIKINLESKLSINVTKYTNKAFTLIQICYNQLLPTILPAIH